MQQRHGYSSTGGIVHVDGARSGPITSNMGADMPSPLQKQMSRKGGEQFAGRFQGDATDLTQSVFQGILMLRHRPGLGLRALVLHWQFFHYFHHSTLPLAADSSHSTTQWKRTHGAVLFFFF